MLQLQPVDIAAAYTLVQIETRIAEITTAIDLASSSKSDQFNDMQASQKVERQNITELNNLLAVWIKAKNLKTGADSSTADIIAAEYTGVNII